jgi:hypothetical protein
MIDTAYAATMQTTSIPPLSLIATEINAIIETGGESVNSAPTVPISRYSTIP